MPVTTRSLKKLMSRFTVAEVEAAEALLELRRACVPVVQIPKEFLEPTRPKRSTAAPYTPGMYTER